MTTFLATLLGILLIIGAVLAIPIATNLMNRAGEHLEHFARWRFAGVLVLLAGIGCVILAFMILSR